MIEDRLGEWRRLLRASPTQARAVLQRILAERIVFKPNPEHTGYTFEAKTRFSGLFVGIGAPAPVFLNEGDARGTEHIGLEDTHDVDYGKLLEKAESSVKRMASPRGTVGFTLISEVLRPAQRPISTLPVIRRSR